MTDEQRSICLAAIDHYGIVHQKRKALEELAELAVEIAHDLDRQEDRDAILEELADVIIMCEQMRIIYGGARVDRWIRYKTERLSDRMGGGHE